jgi:P-type Ca2+ transporter type 2C
MFNLFERYSSLQLVSNRRLDNKFNVFEGIRRNLFFIGINVITVGGQVIIIYFGGSALSTNRLNGTEWAISIIIGAISLPVAVLIRLIPDDFIRKFIPRPRNHNQTPVIRVSSDERFEWNDALENIRDQLSFLQKIRGGRVTNLMSKLQGSRELLLGPSRDSIPGTPNTQANGDAGGPHHDWTRSRSNSGLGPAAVMAGVIAGSVAGWSPLERSSRDGGSIRFSS